VRLAYHMMSAPSPIGLLFLARTAKGLRYLEFMDRKSLKRMIAKYKDANPEATWDPSLLELKGITEQLEAYFLGTLREFEIPLDPVGSDFQMKAWKALREIPYGETRTYGDIARAVGQPKATRAVGLANHDNPLAIVIPCHRVIGANGSLTGYGGGVHRKRWLLEHEARHSQPAGRQGDLFAAAGAGGGRRSSR
jgi:O-6-methylguanine DNA methyltransferase